MAYTNVKPKPRLRLLIDKEKDKVVFAEAGKDFFDLLTLPMGPIVGLLEKHQNQKPSIVGCFHNLYKSVSAMNVDDFETDICKSHRRKLKLHVDDGEATKVFICPNHDRGCCRKVYSNWSTTMCRSCGRLMTWEIKVEEEQITEVFLHCKSSFIITDDLKVALSSTGYILSVLNDLGYDGFDRLEEMLIDVSFEQVVTLPWFLFTSEAPLTDSFLKKKSMTRSLKMSTSLLQERGVARDANNVLTLKVFVRKTDNVILYAECREDLVDFLCRFLAIPLVCAWERSTDNVNKGCVSNLFGSLKVLNFEQPEKSEVYKCMLPYYYSIGAQLLDLVVEDVPEYEVAVDYCSQRCVKFSRKIQKDIANYYICELKPVDSTSLGLLRGETNFIVTDDLVVTPTKLCSRVSMLSKLKTRISDIEEHVISFGKSEAISLLRASLITTSALNNGLSNFLPTKVTSSTSKIIKTEHSL